MWLIFTDFKTAAVTAKSWSWCQKNTMASPTWKPLSFAILYFDIYFSQHNFTAWHMQQNWSGLIFDDFKTAAKVYSNCKRSGPHCSTQVFMTHHMEYDCSVWRLERPWGWVGRWRRESIEPSQGSADSQPNQTPHTRRRAFRSTCTCSQAKWWADNKADRRGHFGPRAPWRCHNMYKYRHESPSLKLSTWALHMVTQRQFTEQAQVICIWTAPGEIFVLIWAQQTLGTFYFYIWHHFALGLVMGWSGWIQLASCNAQTKPLEDHHQGFWLR